MTYHVSIDSIDSTKMIKIDEVWDVMQMQYENYGSSVNLTSSNKNIPQRLIDTLGLYKQKKQKPIQLYTVSTYFCMNFCLLSYHS